MNRNSFCWYNLLRGGSFIVCLITVYGLILSILGFSKSSDPMVKIRSKFLGNFLNGWCISHFLLFFYWGYNYPKCFKEAMSLGMMWELFEYSFGEYFPVVAPSIAFKIDPFWTDWYYGCSEDIIMNMIGFISGSWLRQIRDRLMQKDIVL